jgi:hypothetical protein
MAWVNPVKRALKRMAGRADMPAGLPAPLVEEIVEMSGDPDLGIIAEEKRRRERERGEWAYSRYGYLVFMSTFR